ncbi:MAG: hypothetical protein M1818_006587 [Claussenomyces sp. TS43310]|nr:MAG: hypothetical protein M1818_006587 [Claussenomyces sp. TS43310]
MRSSFIDSPECAESWNSILRSKKQSTSHSNKGGTVAASASAGAHTPVNLRATGSDRAMVTSNENKGTIRSGQQISMTQNSPPMAVVSKLTREALLAKTGTAPPEFAGTSLDQVVSDAGVHHEDLHQPEVKKTDSRGFLAESWNDLVDWRGGWNPAPASWENDRAMLSATFMPSYIQTWTREIPQLSSMVDTSAQEYSTGRCSVSLTKFMDPVEQPDAFPDVAGSSNIYKQRNQTAELEAKIKIRKVAKAQRYAIQTSAALERNLQLIANEALPPNPNTPSMAVYLRPAVSKDVSGITDIMNHYILNSIISEDQNEVGVDDIFALLSDTMEESLPFIVAIRGHLSKARTNPAEIVVGFAYAEGFFGLRNTTGDSSRFTAVLRFYVHPEHTRKGIGRCLLDRILQCTSRMHGGKDGYDWSNPQNDPVYHNQGGTGPRRFHQLLIERRIETKNDPDHAWMKKWLRSSFFFDQVALFRSTARTSPNSVPARWLDVVLFQYEAASELEFEPFV